MRKFITFITVIGFSLIFACCRQYAADIEEFLSYWHRKPPLPVLRSIRNTI